MNGGVLVYPQVGRTGLGNLLFPWARAEAYAASHGLKVLAPQWQALKIGPILRGERDWRLYGSQFANLHCVKGIGRWWALAFYNHVAEPEDLQSVPDGRNRVVVFKGMAGKFEPFFGMRRLIRRRLWEIASERIRTLVQAGEPKEPVIAVHIRRGDHGRVLSMGEAAPTDHWLWTIPTQWFAAVISQVRRVVGDLPVWVFSDARPEDLREVTELPGACLMPAKPALADMLLMSRASVLIPSPSSFSEWAAFLGGMVSIGYPCGLSMQFSRHGDPAFDAGLRGELAPDCVSRLKSTAIHVHAER